MILISITKKTARKITQKYMVKAKGYKGIKIVYWNCLFNIP